ncbi:DprA-like winged helix domain-containing protein [Gynurincola endophyticus]|uniref:DprA-like winged helix domain-containing protein n=1 Tax=Gynurincola endophyticus TaxID=2479004 RepID=UPI000F8CC402|nr:hypothetical protein [Gynurincola endophyticus]
MSKEEQEIVHFLTVQRFLHFDDLLQRVPVSMADLTHRLLLLEMNNYIQCLPGRYYCLNKSLVSDISSER